MRNIIKLTEPDSLAQHRCQYNAKYGNLPTTTKNELRNSLLEEQKHLCCYCMSRIKTDNSRIEHWKSQKRFPGIQLTYSNLLLACEGNEGSKGNSEHCDVSKKEKDILYNPSDPTHNIAVRIKYLANGTIESNDTAFNKELTTVLNLNFYRLQQNRSAIHGAVVAFLDKTNGPTTRGALQNQIRRWKATSGDGSLRAFNAVAIYFLEKRLRRFDR